ncbi:hypothetical protein HZH68_012799 [Vespula germanica]|uniref:Uncharacterized protein n=1 Tax=Vespula germanica TaxID=30212 RepID=A0A834MVR3_VESGE|nr:hypothetical protein HZH68_012799 [Vespula germanica]
MRATQAAAVRLLAEGEKGGGREGGDKGGEEGERKRGRGRSEGGEVGGGTSDVPIDDEWTFRSSSSSELFFSLESSSRLRETSRTTLWSSQAETNFV